MSRGPEPPFFLKMWPMNALMIYPNFPDTFWSSKHLLRFRGNRDAQSPLGLMTVAAQLPEAWTKRLVDTNVERFRDRDLAWANVALVSGMHIQRNSLAAIVERCARVGCELLHADLLQAAFQRKILKRIMWSSGGYHCMSCARPVYLVVERPEMSTSPLPELSPIKMHRYSTLHPGPDDFSSRLSAPRDEKLADALDRTLVALPIKSDTCSLPPLRNGTLCCILHDQGYGGHFSSPSTE